MRVEILVYVALLLFAVKIHNKSIASVLCVHRSSIKEEYKTMGIMSVVRSTYLPQCLCYRNYLYIYVSLK